VRATVFYKARRNRVHFELSERVYINFCDLFFDRSRVHPFEVIKKAAQSNDVLPEQHSIREWGWAHTLAEGFEGTDGTSLASLSIDI
jgi:hypothetical protein